MQNKLRILLKDHKKDLLISSFWIVVLIGVFYTLSEPLDAIHLPTLLEMISGQSKVRILLLTLLGMISVSSLCLFDFILSKHLKIEIKTLEIFKIAWLSYTAGNFMVHIGNKYSDLRYFLYKFQGVGNKKATLMNIFRNTLYVSNNNDDEVSISTQTRIYLTSVVILHWCLAALFFYYIIFLTTGINAIISVITVFLMASLLGGISKFPKGIGIFEAICLLGFYLLGYTLTPCVAGIILYRIYYNVIPWLLSMIFLTLQIANYKNIKLSPNKRRIIYALGIQALAALMFFAGVFALITAYSPTYQKNSSGYTQLIYMGIGLITLILSKSIYDKVSSAYGITLGILILSITYAVCKQFSWIEIVFLIVLFVLVYKSKDCFYRKRAQFSWLTLLTRFGVLALVSMFYIRVYSTILIDNNLPSLIDLKNASYLMLWCLLALLGAILISLTQVAKPFFLPPTEEELSALGVFLNSYEGNSMTHLLYLKDKSLFYGADGKVLIGFRPYKDKLIALGDPIGDQRYFNEAINEFRVYAHQFDMVPLFYEVSDKYLSLYHENGFRFLKLGEEAVVALRDFTLIGKRGASLRTIKNKMDRKELEFELLEAPLSQEVMSRLKEISDDWLEGRKEKGFSLGFFDQEYINRAPVGIVKKDGEIVGFATILPHYCKHTVSIDLMRMVPHPPNGAMDALFIGLLLWAIDEKFERFILGKAPLSNVGTHKFCTPSEKVAKYIYEYGNKVYSFKGLRRYKEKFYPEWEGTYLAYPKGTNLPSAILNLTRLISGSDDSKG